MSSLNQNVIRHKIGLLNLATELGNVSRACKLMGLSRETFYRYQNAMADAAWKPCSTPTGGAPIRRTGWKKPPKPAVLAYTTEQPPRSDARQQ